MSTLSPSPKYRTKMVVTVLLIFGICILPFALLGLIPQLRWIYVGWFLVGNALWLFPTMALIPLYWRSLRYELADEEIIIHKGIITVTEQIIPYRAVTNVEVKRGPLDRWFGLGSIAIHTAGYSQEGGPEGKLSGLADHSVAHEVLLTTLRHYRLRAGQTPIERPGEPIQSSEVARLLTEIRDELRALRQDRNV